MCLSSKVLSVKGTVTPKRRYMFTGRAKRQQVLLLVCRAAVSLVQHAHKDQRGRDLLSAAQDCGLLASFHSQWGLELGLFTMAKQPSKILSPSAFPASAAYDW